MIQVGEFTILSSNMPIAKYTGGALGIQNAIKVYLVWYCHNKNQEKGSFGMLHYTKIVRVGSVFILVRSEL